MPVGSQPSVKQWALDASFALSAVASAYAAAPSSTTPAPAVAMPPQRRRAAGAAVIGVAGAAAGAASRSGVTTITGVASTGISIVRASDSIAMTIVIVNGSLPRAVARTT